MPLYKEFLMGDIGVAVWKITETAEELSSLVAPDCAAEAALIGGEVRRREWLAVRALVACLYGNAARILYNIDGKPSLAGVDEYISISHTKGYALLARSSRAPLGVDVELASRDVSAVAAKFMKRSDELSLSPAFAKKAMLIRWCVCEALFKLVGDVGGTYKDNVFLESSLPGPDGTIAVELRGCNGCPDCSFSTTCIETEGLCIVCVSSKKTE